MEKVYRIPMNEDEEFVFDLEAHRAYLHDSRPYGEDIDYSLVKSEIWESTSKEIADLKDKVHRRNMQIKDLKTEVKKMERDFNALRNAFFNGNLSQKEFIGIVEEIVQRSQ